MRIGDVDARHRHNLQIRVPVDDTYTQVFRVNFVPSDIEKSPADAPVPFRYSQLKKGSRDYDLSMVSAQDSMAWETQGPVTDRTQARLGVEDEGIIYCADFLKSKLKTFKTAAIL